MESIIFRIMDLKELHQLEEEIEQMSDAKERKARLELLEQIMEKITDYDVHIREYAYRQSIQALIERGVIFEPIPRDSVVEQWDEQFDQLVSLEAKQAARHYTDQFRWHLFSFELLPAAKGDTARAAFDETEKQELYLFFDYADDTYRVKNAHLLTANDIEALRENSSLDLSDMYFFDPMHKWTYIKPHEDYCGPYFFKADGSGSEERQ